jgi:hypothetical protein
MAGWAGPEAGQRGRARAVRRADSGSGPNRWRRPARKRNEIFDFRFSNLNAFQTSNPILNKKKAFYGFGPKIKVAQN